MELFKKNLVLELLSAALLSVTLCFFGPLEIMMSQAVEFSFSASDVLLMALGAFILVFALLMLIMLAVSKISKKVLKAVISVIAALGFCAYIQGNWTFVDYGSMNGTAIDWSNYTSWNILWKHTVSVIWKKMV